MHDISYIQAVLLGLLQGITEFLPVSSTAHMEIAPQLLGMRDPGASFSAIAQLGPIVAIIFYFRADLVRYVQGMIRTGSPTSPKLRDDLDARLGWFTILGTIPLVIFGILLEKKIDHSFRDMRVTAVSLIVLALVLLYAERVAKRNRGMDTLTLKESQVIGWAQVLALIPGTSRSGVTLTAGLLQGLDRESAARFSFLLSIPAITAAGLYKLFKVAKTGGLHGDIVPYILAAVVAGVFAYVIVRWFLGYMKEHSTIGFIIYRIVLGITLLWLLHAGFVQKYAPNDDENPSTVTQSIVSPTP